MKTYLDELGVLIGRRVHAEDLESPQQAARISADPQKFKNLKPVEFEIKFSDKASGRFQNFIRNLRDSNPTAIYVWTPRTADCGVLCVPSIDAIDFGFDFTLNGEGILVLRTADLVDRLLLDFYVNSTGEKMLKVEVHGSNWSGVTY